MVTKEQVDMFIDTSILHSKEYDKASTGQQTKAINQAMNTLAEQLDVNKDKLTVQDVAEQAVFLFKIDKTLEQAELGVESVSVDGISISLSNVDTTLAPSIKRRYRIAGSRKVRAGSYITPSLPYRQGQPYPRL